MSAEYVYVHARMDTPATLSHDLGSAVDCMTVLRKEKAGTSVAPVAKLYMTQSREFVVHWEGIGPRDSLLVKERLRKARDAMLDDAEHNHEIHWPQVLYDVLTGAAEPYVNRKTGSTAMERLSALLSSIRDESAYCAIVKYWSGEWPKSRDNRLIRDGFDSTVPFLLQVDKAMKWLSHPSRVQYLKHDDSDLKWDLDDAARKCLRKNYCVVWEDLRELPDSRILQFTGMNLDIAAQILARRKKNGEA